MPNDAKPNGSSNGSANGASHGGDGADDRDPTELECLTEPVIRARRGLRREVAPLVAALDVGALLVPLAKSPDDLPIGEPIAAEGEITLVPHLMPHPDGSVFVPLFTEADMLTTVGKYVEWLTDEEELQYCTLPAKAALDLALQLVDGEKVLGVVVNPGDDSELLLQRHEIGAFAQGQAIPLVGYVAELGHDPREKALVAELDEPPSPEMIAAIESCVSGVAGIKGYRLEQTFNAERDLEPHPTLTIELSGEAEVDRDKVASGLFESLEGKLPQPGYIDVLFEEV